MRTGTLWNPSEKQAQLHSDSHAKNMHFIIVRDLIRGRGKSCIVHVQFQTVKITLSGHLEDVPEYLKKSEEFVGTRAALEPGLNFCKVMKIWIVKDG